MASSNGLKEVLIISGARTPIGNFGGALKTLKAPALGVIAARAAIERASTTPSSIEEVYFGNVLQAGVGQSPARQVALGAGCPDSTEATTINKVCASGMKSIMLAAQNIQTGQREVMLAGGMESMSNAPFYFPRNASYGNQVAEDACIKDGLWDVYNNFHMGNCAEASAKKNNITREDQDAYALESYRRAAAAWKSGAFKSEVVPVTLPNPRGEPIIVSEDEEYTKVKPDKVASLKPVFIKDGSGTVTAANASPINDGASAVVLASPEAAQRLNLAAPLAKIIAFADRAGPPVDFPMAPALHAIPAALEKAGLKKEDIALWEVNEAFSIVGVGTAKVLGISPEKINVNGGAVALGHPIGSSGSRIVITLAYALKKGEYGVAGICNGGGGASAIVIQRL